MGTKKIPLEDRLEKWTQKTQHTDKVGKVWDCWNWLGQTGSPANEKRYAFIKYEGRKQKTATVVFVWKNGPVPEGLEVSHICSNDLCVNPDHLIAETHAENLKRRNYKPERWVFNCKHCGRLKEEVKSGKKTEWVCISCRATRAAEWRKRTGYKFKR